MKPVSVFAINRPVVHQIESGAADGVGDDPFRMPCLPVDFAEAVKRAVAPLHAHEQGDLAAGPVGPQPSAIPAQSSSLLHGWPAFGPRTQVRPPAKRHIGRPVSSTTSGL